MPGRPRGCEESIDVEGSREAVGEAVGEMKGLA
jgi:hypothetical protein